MPDLREQLARRIFDIIWKGNPPVDRVSIEPVADLKGTSYGKLADECIRQMEWAREQPREALRAVQGADDHDGQYDGCSLCWYHAGEGFTGTQWGQHEDDCPVGNALKAPLAVAPEGWRTPK